MAKRNAPASASARQRVATPPIRFASEKSKQREAKKIQGGLFSSLTSFGIRVAIFYTIFAALWHCPSRPLAFDYSTKDARPVCRNIALAHEQLAPVLSPYIEKAKLIIEPYSKPAIETVSPYATKAWKVSRPYYRSAQRRGKLIYKKHVDPLRRRALKRAKAGADPYLVAAHVQYDQHVQPKIDLVRRHTKPYRDIYQRDVSPYVQQAYKYSLQSSSVSYAFYVDKVHPRVVQALRTLHSFLVNHVDPSVRRIYSLYVRPQVSKLTAKLYERKAHWLGSDAIKAATSESLKTRQAAQANAQAAVEAAEQAAHQAQSDPSLIDRVKLAKDAVLGTKDEDPIETAKLDAELEAEEATVKEQLEIWETNMGALIEKEYRLAIDRLIDLRNRAMADLPDRFGSASEGFVEDQVAIVLSRIERGLKKLSNVEPLDSRLIKGRELLRKQLAKLDGAAQATKVEVAGFYEQLVSEERQVVETSSHEIARFAKAAKKAFDTVMTEAKFAETMDEWEGWDKGVRKRANLYLQDLGEVQRGERKVNADSGARDLGSEAADVAPQIAHLRTQADRLFSAARREVEAFGESGLAQLRGDGVIAKLSDAADSIADQASTISLEAAAGMLAAVQSARSRLGLGDPSPEDTGYFARAKSYAQSAVDSANAAVSDAYSAVSDGASSLGGRASPSSASSEAAKAASAASSMAHQATRSVASALGVQPTPESLAEHVDSVTARVSQSVASVASAASDAVVDAQSFILDGEPASAYSSAASQGAAAYAAATSKAADVATTISEGVEAAIGRPASSTGLGSSVAAAAGTVLSDAKASASSIAHGASKAGVIAVGGTPAPETLNEHAEQIIAAVGDKASEVLAAAASAATPVVSPVAESLSAISSQYVEPAVGSATRALHEATRSIQSAVGATPSPEGFSEHLDYAGKKVGEKIEEVGARIRDEL